MTYGQSCSTYLCNPNFGLTCSGGSGAACPNSYGANICDCTSSQYWTGSACASKSSWGGSCSTRGDCQCVQGIFFFRIYLRCLFLQELKPFKGVGLSCQGNQCLCPSGSQWFWSPYSTKCVQCPSGWTIYTDRCYYYTSATTTWSGANSICTNAGGYLIIIDDNTEYSRLVSFYQSSGAAALWVFILFIEFNLSFYNF